jgi:hypothetical protein
MNKAILIEALEIAVNNFEYDGDYTKAREVRAYLAQVSE